jgi:cell pole-organizing protein PopZ
MSEPNSQEPTMEEILASIRRIISEDDAPADEGAGPAASAAAAPEPAPEPEPAAVAEPVVAFDPPPAPEPEPEPAAAAPEPEPEDEEVLELTERVDTVGDLDVYTPAEPAPAPAYVAPEPEPAPAPVAESLVGAVAASAAASAFGKLSAAVAMPADGQTLDGVVRELLKPLLKDWLDANLPAIVQTAVQEEVERIARSRR